jgi:hypothetical protein
MTRVTIGPQKLKKAYAIIHFGCFMKVPNCIPEGGYTHAPDLILPIPMASQVHWGRYNSLTAYLQPTPWVAIQALESKVYAYCQRIRIFYDVVNKSCMSLLKWWKHTDTRASRTSVVRVYVATHRQDSPIMNWVAEKILWTSTRLERARLQDDCCAHWITLDW